MSSTKRTFTGMLLATVVVVSGCAPASDAGLLEDIDSARGWANRSSAVGVWNRVHDLVAAGDARDPFHDPECPTIVADGAVVTVSGGCTANDGQVWVGSATILGAGTDDEQIVISDFGHSEDPELVATLSGTVLIRAPTEGGHTFELDLVNDAPFEGVMTILYEGTIEGGYVGPTTWNGTGTIALEGESISASTTAEVWDETVCRGAPASGQTTMTSDAHTVVITYDGAVACDEDKNAAWSLDGADMGPIDGISCSVSGPGGRPWFASLALMLAAVVLLRRRRRGASRR